MSAAAAGRGGAAEGMEPRGGRPYDASGTHALSASPLTRVRLTTPSERLPPNVFQYAPAASLLAPTQRASELQLARAAAREENVCRSTPVAL